MPLRLTCDAELLKDRKPEEQNWCKACVWAAGVEITWRPEAFSAFHCKRGSRPGRGSPPPHASRSPWPTLRRQSESRSGPTKAFHAVRRQSRPRCLPWRCRTFLRPKGKGLMPGAGRVAVHVFMWELRSHHNAQRCHSLAAQGSMFCFLDTSSAKLFSKDSQGNAGAQRFYFTLVLGFWATGQFCAGQRNGEEGALATDAC